jgi:hypothetical protein
MSRVKYIKDKKDALESVRFQLPDLVNKTTISPLITGRNKYGTENILYTDGKLYIL